MTDLLFQTDSYLQDFSGIVSRLIPEENAIVMNRTAFYPGGGGQPGDIGIITLPDQSERKVLKVRKDGSELLHILEGELPELGTQIQGKIDWGHRYPLMRTHTALHILCGVVYRDYGAQVTGGNMEPLKGRMDFEFETLRGELVNEIEIAVNKEVAANREVRVKILPREEAFLIPDLIRTKINLLPEGIREVRTVEIVGLDLQADGGTHVRNTTEVGRIKIVDYKSKGAINKRIYIEVQ
jgi:misacylated tRNA(Ala) deacylase